MDTNTLPLPNPNPREYYLPVIRHKISVFLGVLAGQNFCLNLLIERLKNDPELAGNVDPYWIGRGYVSKILKEYGCQRHQNYLGRAEGKTRSCSYWHQVDKA